MKPALAPARAIARAGLAALACIALLSFAAPAQAQTEETLLSNLPSRHATNGATVGDSNAGENWTAAQLFQTGETGATLSSVKSYVQGVSGTNFTARVSIYRANLDTNLPETTSLYTLTGTVTGSGEVTFTAPPNATLTASTSYYVVFEDTNVNTPLGYFNIATVSDTDEDTAFTDWTLDRRHYRNGVGTWRSADNQAIAIELIGATDTTSNTAPTASDGSVTTAQNTAYPFSTDDFNFEDTDTGDTLEKVKIVTLPGAGTLALDGTPVTADQEVMKADIDNDKLTFTPATDASGSPYTTFTFKVNDGTDESASAYTMTVNVTEASDMTSALVSNIGQAGSAFQSLLDENRAQSFTTGTHSPGYDISSVEIVSLDPQGDSFSLSLCTVDSSGFPTSDCTALTAPSSFAAGTLEFTAPANTRLAASTNYTLRIGITGSVLLGSNTSNDEDSGSATGWSIGNDHTFQYSDLTWDDSGLGISFRIAINGDEASNTATLSNLRLSQHGNRVALSPVFASDVTAYSATVANSVSSVTVTATRNDAGASVAITGDTDTTTPDEATFDLSVGSRTITVTVTAADANNTETYTLTVEREALGQFELLSSTLTGIEDFGQVGCFGALQDARCSNSPVLSENEFTYDGDRYGIRSLYFGHSALFLEFDNAFTNGAPKDWILRVDGMDFAFSSASPSGYSLGWTGSSVPTRSAGDPVSVRIFRTNAAPTASDGSVTTTQNTAYPFSAYDFNFLDIDAGDTLEKVKIVTLPGAGTLVLGSTPVTADQEVTKADIDGGELTFTPATGATGSPYTTFTFKVNDGDDESAATYTMTVNVMPLTPDVLVSNLAAPRAPGVFLDLRVSQAFTTGADPHGYKLSSVTVRVRGRSDSTRELRVDLYTTNSSNDPDDRIFRFDGPGPVPTGISNVTVNAPAGTRLDPSTTYHIVYTQSGGSGGQLAAVETSSDAETGATGWTIANNGQSFNNFDWVNLPNSYALNVGVEGTAATDMPYVTSVTVEDAPSDGLGYETGEEITVSVTFSEAVDVTGTPRFPLQIGDSDRQAAYSASRESDTVLDFTYTVQASDHDNDGLEVPSNLFDLNGGSVKRASSTVDADLDKPSASPGAAYSVNAVVLTGVAMESTAVNRYYTLGEHIEIGATFSEAVDVTGTPQLSFCVNRSSQDCNLVSADYNRGAGSAELVFRYTVKAGDDDNNGIWIGEDAISLNSGTISRSGTTEAAGLLHSALSTQGSHRVYHGPVVRSVEVTSMPQAAADTYGASEMIQFTVTFSEPVKVSSGRPHFEYSLGSSGNTVTREAAYESGSGTNALEFADTVLVDDNDDNGIWVGDNTDTIKLETGEYIRSVALQVEAVLGHGVLGTQSGHKVDGSLTPPNIPPTASDGTVKTAQNTAYAFSADDFNFADADTGDTLDKVKIVTLPGAGMLALDGAAVTVN